MGDVQRRFAKLARFKSANAKLLALQGRKAMLDRMAAELDDSQAVQPTGIRKELNKISPDEVWMQVQDSSYILHNLLLTMYIWKDIMLVSQNSKHNGVCQCNLRLTSHTMWPFPT